MSNPYQPPSSKTASDEHSVESSKWSDLLIAAFVAALGTTMVLAIHRWFGLGMASSLLESLIWVLFALAIGTGFYAMAVTFGLVRHSVVLHRTLRLAMAITGLSILALHGFNALNALVSGTGNERFAFYRRALGNYFWHYWLTIGLLGVLPVLLFISRLRSNIWFCAPALILVATMSAFYLRFNFVIKYSDSLPSSWQMFPWPF